MGNSERWSPDTWRTVFFSCLRQTDNEALSGFQLQGDLSHSLNTRLRANTRECVRRSLHARTGRRQSIFPLSSFFSVDTGSNTIPYVAQCAWVSIYSTTFLPYLVSSPIKYLCPLRVRTHKYLWAVSGVSRGQSSTLLMPSFNGWSSCRAVFCIYRRVFVILAK